jgi:hypothetical protein
LVSGTKNIEYTVEMPQQTPNGSNEYVPRALCMSG